MDILLDTRRSAAGGDHADHALLQAVAGTGPDWTVFRDCALADGHHGAPARVRYALLHPEVGIALLDVLPGATAQRGPERLRALLDAAAFRPAFGDYPPIIHLCLPWRSLLRLGALMEQRFAALPPLALAGGDAWVGAAQRVLTAGPPLRLPGHAAAGKPPVLLQSLP